MIIDWFQLAVAVLLLWLPRQVLRAGGKVFRLGHRRRRFDTNPAKSREAGDPSVSLRDEIVKPRNTIDLARAALGSVALLGSLEGVEPALRVGDHATPGLASAVFYAAAAILLIGVLVQTVRYEGRVSLYAPIFYLSGLTLGACGLYPALASLVLVWTINLALPNPAAFLTIYALLVATFGLLFGGLAHRWPFVAAGLIFMPVLISLLWRRRLATFTKRLKLPGVGPAT